MMKLIGQLKGEPDTTGCYALVLRDLSIPVRGSLERFKDARVHVEGELVWSGCGSYFHALHCHRTGEPDRNIVRVKGTVVDIFPERLNARNRRSACLIVQQTDDPESSVLVTALSNNVDTMFAHNPTIGAWVDIVGYVATHRKGLHVLFAKYATERGENHVRKVQKPEH